MKRFLLVTLGFIMGFAFQAMDAPDAEAQSSRCRRLARRVASYQRIRSSYLRAWRRCKWRSGSYSPRCRRLRRTVNRWYANVRNARRNYRAWGCSFGWNRWSDPWARRRRVRYRRAKCRSLLRTVNSYRRIRASYLRAWNRCKWRSGRYSPRCRRLKASVNRWYANVRNARANYQAWGCRFAWNSWDDPWAARRRRGRYRRAKCRSLSSQVRVYSRIRSRYSRRYNRWRCYRSSRRYSRYCRSLRIKIRSYQSRVRAARANYRAWGCRFAWRTWKNPWN